MGFSLEEMSASAGRVPVFHGGRQQDNAEAKVNPQMRKSQILFAARGF
jgi:hypothetical protein